MFKNTITPKTKFLVVQSLFIFFSISIYSLSGSELKEPLLNWRGERDHKQLEEVIQLETKMSRRNGDVPKLDLKLNLSPPRANPFAVSPRRSVTVSPPSSCVSSELDEMEENPLYSSSPEATSMVLAGCPRCLMYVMLSQDDHKCPKCKSTVLLDFMQDFPKSTTTALKKTRKS